MRVIVLIMFWAMGFSAPAFNTIGIKCTLQDNSGIQGIKATFPVLLNSQINQERSLSNLRKESSSKSIPAIASGIPETNVLSMQSNLNDPVITVYPTELSQNGNYIQSCAPPQVYTVSGSNLTSDLIVAMDENWGYAEISLTPDGEYSTSLSLTPINGTLEETPVYVRNCPMSGLSSDQTAMIGNSSSGVTVCIPVSTIALAGDAPQSTIGNIFAEPGSVVIIPVTVVNFDYISMAGYIIEYNPNVMTFLDIEFGFPTMIDVYDDSITSNLSRLYITIGSTSDNYFSVSDNDILFEMVFTYISSNSTLTFTDNCSFQNAWWQLPNDEPYADFYHNGSVSPVTKNVNLALWLENLYNPVTEKMNKAHGQDGEFYPDNIADMITVKLAQSEYPYSIAYTFENVNLNQNGTSCIHLPVSIGDNYYIGICHRNSIETWSGTPVSFIGSSIVYDFTHSAGNAFGNNLKLINGKFCIYGGDVNQDGVVDTGDMTPVDNDAANFATGYLSTDLTGDGIVDTADMTIVDNNANTFIHKIVP